MDEAYGLDALKASSSTPRTDSVIAGSHESEKDSMPPRSGATEGWSNLARLAG